ncbi:unnamed protein product [Dovyalis caffra]|uniref:Uncharacterized protein n=1 Tax=Dovyalis caffra TaxID=77055 RepID=A0AAV1QTH7_9ROSI|nr:unnamed protein product [Dovyalis caffra]
MWVRFDLLLAQPIPRAIFEPLFRGRRVRVGVALVLLWFTTAGSLATARYLVELIGLTSACGLAISGLVFGWSTCLFIWVSLDLLLECSSTFGPVALRGLLSSRFVSPLADSLAIVHRLVELIGLAFARGLATSGLVVVLKYLYSVALFGPSGSGPLGLWSLDPSPGRFELDVPGSCSVRGCTFVWARPVPLWFTARRLLGYSPLFGCGFTCLFVWARPLVWLGWSPPVRALFIGGPSLPFRSMQVLPSLRFALCSRFVRSFVLAYSWLRRALQPYSLFACLDNAASRGPSLR